VGGGKVAPSLHYFKITLALPQSRLRTTQDLLDARLLPFEVELSPPPGEPVSPALSRLHLYAESESQRDEWLSFLKRHGLDRVTTVRPFAYSPDEWVESWKEFYHWVEVSPNLAVGPDFRPCPFPVRHAIAIDPGQAFGTGGHQSTRLALGLMDPLFPGPGRVLDVGCGTGVLAMAARKLGAGLVLGLDIDQEACRETLDNAEANDCRVAVIRGGVEAVATRFDLVVANMLSVRLLAAAAALKARVAPGGRLILSGLTADERDGFETRFFHREDDFEVEERLELDGWWAAACRRKPAP